MEGDVQTAINTFFNIHQMIEVFPRMLTVGFVNTLILSLSATAIGLVLGLALALLLLSDKRYVRVPARVYVDIFRGLPGLLTIFLIGVGLPIAGLRIFGRTTYVYAALALGIILGAYIAEIFRGGIQSVDRGQMEAARSVGMSYMQAMRFVVVPQGVRRILPALTGQLIIAVKESALIYILGLLPSQQELFSISQDASAQYVSMSPVVLAGAFYLVITVPLTKVVNILDTRLREGRRDMTAGLRLDELEAA